jgi:SAM-dependent methyltransferase
MTKEEKIRKILISDANFRVQNKSYCFLSGDRMPHQTAGKGLLGKTQDWLKTYGKLYYSLLKLFGPVFSSFTFRRSIHECLDKYSENHVIINLGSGPQYFHGRTDIINVDLFAFDEVDIVADACNLPIEEQRVDFIVNIAMLEHVDNPHTLVHEMYRILKPSGEMLAYVPFIVPYHAAPDDFYRWTISGIKTLFSNFNEVEVFVGAGPTSGLLWVFQEWFAILCSFGNKTLHDIIFLFLMVVTAPMKLLDIFLERLPNSENIASGFCIIAKK